MCPVSMRMARTNWEDARSVETPGRFELPNSTGTFGWCELYAPVTCGVLLDVELPGHHYDGLLQSSSAAAEPIMPIISASCCGQTWWIAVISTSAPSV